MLRWLSRPAVRLVERYLPDPYVFVLILTLVAAGAAIAATPTSAHEVLRIWGDGFWSLLTFSMQMLLVLVSGFMLAHSPPVARLLDTLARRVRSAATAIVYVTLVSLAASWLNWGFGLVVGALFAKALARHVRVDYRLLVASAYSGFVVWHGGLAGSIPLTIATPGHFTAETIGVIDTGQTLFAGFNLAILAALFVAVPLVNRLMLPRDDESVIASREALEESGPDQVRPSRPAEHLEHSRLLAGCVGLAGLAYLADYFFLRGQGLNLNVVNFLFLMLSIVLHGTPTRLLASLQAGVRGGAGIVIQFPFYAGIMAIMTQSGLAEGLSSWFASIATTDTLAFWSFISAGIVNLFVPSGGGQWAVQAPVMIPAAQALGADMPRIAMAIAWGDAWTNLLQPFWALPVLAIAGLKAADIMGFCLIQLFVTGIIIAAGLTFL